MHKNVKMSIFAAMVRVCARVALTAPTAAIASAAALG